MTITEQDLRGVAVEIADLCEARGLNLEQTGAVCEFVVECVTLTEILTGED